MITVNEDKKKTNKQMEILYLLYGSRKIAGQAGKKTIEMEEARQRGINHKEWEIIRQKSKNIMSYICLFTDSMM